MTDADPAEPTRKRRAVRIVDLVLLSGVALLVGALSSWNWPHAARAQGEREFFDSLLFHDPYFYFHRVRLTLDAFPTSPLFDRFIFARGAGTDGHVIPAAPGFHLLVSLWCRAWGASAASVLEVARTAAPIVPMIGALAAFLVFAATRVLAPGHRLASLTGAFLLLTIPVHHFYAQYGQVDHQVIEPLMPALAMIFALVSLTIDTRHRTLWAMLAGLCADLALWFWPAAFIPVAIVHAVLFALVLVHGKETIRRALQFSAAALLLSPLLIPAMPRWGFDIWTVSLLQPLLYAAFLVFWIAVWWMAKVRPRARIVALVGLVGVIAGLFALAPGALREGLAFVLRKDPVVAFVPEAQSLLSSREMLTQYLGPHVVLLPIALIALGVLAIRNREQRASFLSLFAWLGATTLLPIVQFRFVTYLSIPLAVGLAVLGTHAWAHGKNTVRGALVLALVASLVLGVNRAIYCQPGARDRDESARLLVERESAFHECALSLRGSEPRFRLARPGSEPLPRPVAVELFMGHQVIALGERPVIASGFGSELESHFVNAELFTLGASDAIALCDESQVQYFFACELPPYLRDGYQRMAAQRAQLPEHSLNERLIHTLGSSSPSERAVTAFRAVFEPEHRGWVRVFERVRGAVLPVATTPGASVMIGVKLECAHGHKLAWQDQGRADQQGHFALCLPYATAEPNGEIRAVEDYRLMVANRMYQVRVSERQVVNGETLGQGEIRPAK